MKELIRYVGIICTVVVIALLTGMYKQPLWFRFVYTFPMIMLLIITTKRRIKVMAHLIDKDALVAEIRKRLLPVIRDKHYDEWEEGQDSERIAILGIIDTLEVKEVDVEKEIEFEYNPIDGLSFEEFARIAKHFYSLGLAQKGE